MRVVDIGTPDELGAFLLENNRAGRRLDRYISGLDEPQRDVFLEEFLRLAWEWRHSHNAHANQLGEYIERCLQGAARSRDRWLVSVATLPGAYEKRWILGHKLGRYA